MKINLFLRAFCYPTEDINKVKKAISNIGIKESDLDIKTVEEAFGLPMFIIEARKKDKSAINILKIIHEKTMYDRFFPFLEKTYVDEDHSSTLRIDKQTLFKENKVKLTPYGDVIFLKIKYVFPNNLEDFKKEFKKLLQ